MDFHTKFATNISWAYYKSLPASMDIRLTTAMNLNRDLNHFGQEYVIWPSNFDLENIANEMIALKDSFDEKSREYHNLVRQSETN